MKMVFPRKSGKSWGSDYTTDLTFTGFLAGEMNQMVAFNAKNHLTAVSGRHKSAFV